MLTVTLVVSCSHRSIINTSGCRTVCQSVCQASVRLSDGLRCCCQSLVFCAPASGSHSSGHTPSASISDCLPICMPAKLSDFIAVVNPGRFVSQAECRNRSSGHGASARLPDCPPVAFCMNGWLRVSFRMNLLHRYPSLLLLSFVL